MAEGEGLIKGGGRLSTHSSIRDSKVRKYQRRVDLRAIMRSYLESPEPVRSASLCRSTAMRMYAKLKQCPPFVATTALRSLKTVSNETAFEAAMDKVWEHAERFRVLLVA